MGQAKARKREGFPDALVDSWEADDCINFAVALARITGWLLHVDWVVKSLPPHDNVTMDKLVPLRVYVQDNREGIFDVRGIKALSEFQDSKIAKRAKGVLRAARTPGGVLTRYYSEEKLSSLPLRSFPDEEKIAIAAEAIKANPTFLERIPVRTKPCLPAYDAARYTFGRCASYAEAMCELTGLPPVAILAKKFSPMYESSPRASNGYFHSIVLHPDGMGEDSWGIARVEDIAARFGVIEFELSQSVYQDVVQNHRKESGDIYEEELSAARDLISKYRNIAYVNFGAD